MDICWCCELHMQQVYIYKILYGIFVCAFLEVVEFLFGRYQKQYFVFTLYLILIKITRTFISKIMLINVNQNFNILCAKCLKQWTHISHIYIRSIIDGNIDIAEKIVTFSGGRTRKSGRYIPYSRQISD